MCGFAGIARRSASGVAVRTLTRMVSAIRHRGPDGAGVLAGSRVGLAHVRLSIVDPEGGAQPMQDPTGCLTVVYNGEIFNHRELRAELERFGHRFRTRCDTEVLLHGYEEWGEELPGRLDGQFAFAIHDRDRRSVLLARDRFGVRPLFYAVHGGDLYFASEVKAILASGEVPARLDPLGLDEVFTTWATRAPRTAFEGIQSLEPGSLARWRDGSLSVRRYYALDYPAAAQESPGALEAVESLLRESVSRRLVADVAVGAYLSGGLDSSLVCALAAREQGGLDTFSVEFEDAALDESGFQREVADHLGARHHAWRIGDGEIADALPAVVWHAETPLTRTAPVPLYLLSRRTREAGLKVVLTGEGADEVFLGYDLFREAKIRRFCLRQPSSARRRRLFERIYAFIPAEQRRGGFWAQSFLRAGDPSDPLFSHLPRFLLTSRIKMLYSREMSEAVGGEGAALDRLRDELPPRFARWGEMDRAAYLEMTTLLSPYLLSSQGDRVSLAHGVEGRYPFLDHHLFEFAAALPARTRLPGLREKALLKRLGRDTLPARVLGRPKQPYLAPTFRALAGPDAPEYVDALLHPRAVAECGVFDPDAVSALLRRCRSGRATGTGESQMLVAVLTTQLWHRAFLGQDQARATSRAEAELVARGAPTPFLSHATPGGSR